MIDWDSHPRVDVPPAKERQWDWDIDFFNVLGGICGIVLVGLMSWSSMQPQYVDNCHVTCETSRMDTNNAKIIDTEKTGHVTRVYVGALDEDDALSVAQEELSTDAYGEVVFHSEDRSYEIIFQNADLD